jgi:hypothetical protein
MSKHCSDPSFTNDALCDCMNPANVALEFKTNAELMKKPEWMCLNLKCAPASTAYKPSAFYTAPCNLQICDQYNISEGTNIIQSNNSQVLSCTKSTTPSNPANNTTTNLPAPPSVIDATPGPAVSDKSKLINNLVIVGATIAGVVLLLFFLRYMLRSKVSFDEDEDEDSDKEDYYDDEEEDEYSRRRGSRRVRRSRRY